MPVCFAGRPRPGVVPALPHGESSCLHVSVPAAEVYKGWHLAVDSRQRDGDRLWRWRGEAPASLHAWLPARMPLKCLLTHPACCDTIRALPPSTCPSMLLLLPRSSARPLAASSRAARCGWQTATTIGESRFRAPRHAARWRGTLPSAGQQRCLEAPRLQTWAATLSGQHQDQTAPPFTPGPAASRH